MELHALLDDVSVDVFALEMKNKLEKSREKGRSGWHTASEKHLSDLLMEHVLKGDPVDVANFAMMLHQNGQRITISDDVKKCLTPDGISVE